MEDLIEDYLYRSGCTCVVEWGDALTQVLESHIHIHIDVEGDKRYITQTSTNTPGDIQMPGGAVT
jgi:tRNA A37 threonylcarbamoyladenosine biosynthesis protein TsaE